MLTEPLVHIIDDDEAVRASLAFLFASSGVAARTYECASAFLEEAQPESSGCVVTDVRMPDMNGIELMRRLREINVQLPIIVMTGHGDVPLAVEAMKAGAQDFLEKPFSDDALLKAVEVALLADSERGKALAKLAQLSPRERQVLEGLVLGHPNKVIGRDLAISDRTVEVYRAKLMKKVAAGSLADLLRVAIAAGMSAPGSQSG